MCQDEGSIASSTRNDFFGVLGSVGGHFVMVDALQLIENHMSRAIVTGLFGTMVQAEGVRIDISKVPMRLATFSISILSRPMNGLRIGISRL